VCDVCVCVWCVWCVCVCVVCVCLRVPLPAAVDVRRAKRDEEHENNALFSVVQNSINSYVQADPLQNITNSVDRTTKLAHIVVF